MAPISRAGDIASDVPRGRPPAGEGFLKLPLSVERAGDGFLKLLADDGETCAESVTSKSSANAPRAAWSPRLRSACD